MRRALLLIPLFVAACEKPPPSAPTAPRIIICATVFPLADIARVVGGDNLRADWILDLGDPTAGFSLQSAERDRLRSVDFVLCDGLRTEGWAADEITAMQKAGNVIALESLPSALQAPATGYLWLDPIVVRDFVPRIATEMRRKIPSKQEDFEKRASGLMAEIDSVLAKHPRAGFRGIKVMTVSPQFDTLLARCGITPVMIDANPLRLTEPEIYDLRRISREQGLTALLLPFDTPPGTVIDIEARTGMRVILIDHLGYANYPGHQSYVEILTYNLAQLQSVATVTSSPVPTTAQAR